MSQRPALIPITNTISLNGGRPSRKSLAPSKNIALINVEPGTGRNPSLGPNSVRQSFIPPPPPSVSKSRPSSIGRQSGSGVKSRSSSFYGNNTVRKDDPRPSDKAFFNQCLKKTIQYLTSHNYERQIATKILSSPTTKDFISIIQFLYRKIDASFTINKLEEDVPNIFKSLKYPFQISKRSLASVGTPHTWPTLLAALTWLVELLNFQEAEEEIFDVNTTVHSSQLPSQQSLTSSLPSVQKQQFSRFSNAAENSTGFSVDCSNNNSMLDRLFWEFVVKSYAHYLDGKDEFQVYEMELESSFDQRIDLVRRETEKMRVLQENNRTEIEKFLNSPEPLDELQHKRDVLVFDVKKFHDLERNLLEHQTITKKKLQDLERELENKENETRQFAKEREQLQSRVAEQSGIAVELERLCLEKSNLEEQLLSLASQREAKQKLGFDSEILLSKKIEEVEQLIQQFNFNARKKKLIPANAKYAKGVAYQMSFNSHSPLQIIEAIKSTIRPGLEELKDELTKATNSAREEGFTIQARVDRCDETIELKKESVSLLETKTRQAEQSYEKEKEMMKSQEREKQLEIDQIIQESNHVKEVIAHDLASSQNSLLQISNDYNSLQTQFKQEEEICQRILFETLEKSVANKAFIQQNLLALNKICGQIKQRITQQSDLFMKEQLSFQPLQ